MTMYGQLNFTCSANWKGITISTVSAQSYLGIGLRNLGGGGWT